MERYGMRKTGMERQKETEISYTVRLKVHKFGSGKGKTKDRRGGKKRLRPERTVKEEKRRGSQGRNGDCGQTHHRGDEVKASNRDR